MAELQLNLVNEAPDSSWSIIFSGEINNISNITIESNLGKYFTLLSNNHIQYISYFTEHVSGIKHPKYSNKLMILVQNSDFEYVQNLLIKNNLLFDKEISEIEEFKDVDIEEPVENELTNNDLPLINKVISIILSTIIFTFGTIAYIFFIWVAFEVKSTSEKVVIIAIISLWTLLGFGIIRNSYKKK